MAGIPGEPMAERWRCDAHDPLNLIRFAPA